MALILSIETSTKVCSVSLAENGTEISGRELYEANSHATHLTVLIQELFEEQKNISMKDIDAVAVSCGPGSYTGLRIGVSAAKGICYALSIPLLAITSLEILANAVMDEVVVEEGALVCPMIDARRMEVYTAIFDNQLKLIKDINALIVDESSFKEDLDEKKIVFIGDGSDKCKEVINSENAIFISDKSPVAKNMNKIAFRKFQLEEFENVAYFEPFYLKDFVATTPKKKVL